MELQKNRGGKPPRKIEAEEKKKERSELIWGAVIAYLLYDIYDTRDK
jgi:hypothetical protein